MNNIINLEKQLKIEKSKFNERIHELAREKYKVDNPRDKSNLDKISWYDWELEDDYSKIFIEGWPSWRFPEEIYISFPIEWIKDDNAIQKYKEQKLAKETKLLKQKEENRQILIKESEYKKLIYEIEKLKAYHQNDKNN